MKKGWIVAILCVVGILAASILGYMNVNSLGISTGRYLLADNGSHLVILEGSPVVMSGAEGQFESLNTGDQIQILHDGILETYPGRTKVYFCRRTAAGTREDIPQEVLEQLTDLGWMNGDKPEICPTDPVSTETVVEGQRVSYGYENANLALTLPQGWEYEIVEYQEGATSFGIYFWPEAAQEGKVRLEFQLQDFGVCGTGLVSEGYLWDNGLEAIVGTYDNQPYWTYLWFQNQPGTYVALTEGVEDWWPDYSSQVMEILGTAQLAQGILTRQEAMDIARQELNQESLWAGYDFYTGRWTVGASLGENEIWVWINPDGTVEGETVQEGPLDRKPVIYLYPEEKMEVTVELELQGKLTAAYPAYENGWRVTAYPDGTLVDEGGREYYCLFWEGISGAAYDVSQGFVVPGADTAAFLEDALRTLGLTDKEANEFLIYWLPQMEGNPYNLISFQQEVYQETARLRITPEPDSVLRVFMVWKSLAEPVEVEPQELPCFERKGFVAVEWGGAEVS